MNLYSVYDRPDLPLYNLLTAERLNVAFNCVILSTLYCIKWLSFKLLWYHYSIPVGVHSLAEVTYIL